jgi:alginate O-acetyltransferase complex protein AlgI
MLFNSLQFLVFFTFVLGFYYAFPHRVRWAWLLLASCYFYMVFVPAYILVLFAVILIDYAAGLLIHRAGGKSRKLFLALSLASNLGILFYFKYYNFFLENVSWAFGLFGSSSPLPYLEVILPIGLSFHTFQAMSYTIEVYRGNQSPERHLGIYALYVLFFPQLVAGPIERPQNLLHQLRSTVVFSRDNLRKGLLFMAWGFFKKAVIADRLAEVADRAFGGWATESSAGMWLGVACYSIQIYCDFSGYSDIAIGAARTMGISLMENFRNPYLSFSLTEFWRRWHISLSTWFRDYVYFPLGGNRAGRWRFCLNITIVFLLSGLWHGARHTFLVWALIHLVFVIAEHFFYHDKEPRSLFAISLRWLYVFIITSLAWVFFRAQSMPQALGIIRKLSFLDHSAANAKFNFTELMFCFVLVLILLTQEGAIKKFQPNRSRRYYAVLASLVAACYIFGIYNYKQFIYFQF